MTIRLNVKRNTVKKRSALYMDLGLYEDIMQVADEEDSSFNQVVCALVELGLSVYEAGDIKKPRKIA
jgi:hypothetical protein